MQELYLNHKIVRRYCGALGQFVAFGKLTSLIMKMKLIYCLLLTCGLLSGNVMAQISGCTDPQSLNYNPAATINDGSCVYGATSLTLTNKANLSVPLLNESSGLTFVDGKMWSFSDSGNPNDIYRVDTTSGAILQTVDISNATNVDWEDMAFGADYLFIGDFGNNNGNRQDLKIYRINKSALTAGATAVTASIINFSYSDQTTYTSLPNNNNFDCEAMIFHNDSIHLFTKNWVDKQTKHYVLPNVPGTHVAQYRETYNTGYLVTSATIQKFGVIALSGYLRSGTFPVNISLLFDYNGPYFFNGNKRTFDVSTQLVYGQVEGIEFSGTSRAFVTNELYTTGTNVPAKLRFCDLASWLPPSFLYPKPDAAFTSGTTSVCQGQTIQFTDQSTDSPVTWQWLFPGGTPASSTQQNPLVQYNTPGVYDVTLIASNGAGSDTLIKTLFITVNSLPIASISANGPVTFCTGGSVQLSAVSGNGWGYQWQINNADIQGAIAATYNAVDQGTYSCKVTNFCGTVVSNLIAVTINSAPVNSNLPSGPGIVCLNSTNNSYSVFPVPGANAYLWSLPSGAILNSGAGSNNIAVDFGASATSGNICVSAINSCGNSASTCKSISVISTAPAKPASLTGSLIQCPGNNGAVYSCATATNAEGYNWIVPSGAVITGGQGTNSITVNFLSGFISGSIKVASFNCAGSSAYRLITVRSKPSTPGLINGVTEGICPGTTQVSFSVAAVAGASSYNWVVPAGVTIASGQGTNSVVLDFGSTFTSGSLKVSAGNICGNSNERVAVLRSVPAKPAAVSGPVSVCANQTNVVYSVSPVTGATGYKWIVPVGATIVSGQGTTTITMNFGVAGGIVKARAFNGCGNGPYRTLTTAVTCRESSSLNAINPDFIIFPNPSSTTFTLQSDGFKDDHVLINITDITGRLVSKTTVASNELPYLFGSTLLPGIYIAEIISAEHRQVIRLVRQ